jgi:ribosomal protein S18 acetylase RimI-like enzyme
MPVRIREAGARDSTSIVHLVHQLAAAGGETSPLTAEYLKKYFAYPGSRVLLAEDGDDAVGLLSYSVRPDLYHAGDSAYIENLVVVKGRRGQGIGAALLKHALAELEAAGCAEVSIAVMPENIGAQRLYRSLGLTDEAVYLEKHF